MFFVYKKQMIVNKLYRKKLLVGRRDILLVKKLYTEIFVAKFSTIWYENLKFFVIGLHAG